MNSLYSDAQMRLAKLAFLASRESEAGLTLFSTSY